MNSCLSILIISLFLLPFPEVRAQSSNSDPLPRLYTQLERDVAQQNWDQAIEIVDQLLELQPQRAENLHPYRQRLVDLAEAAPPNVKILQARGEVFSTRSERRQRQPDSRFIDDIRDIAIVVIPGVGPVIATEYPITVQLPDQYGVEVSFSGPIGDPGEVEVEVTLAGGGEQTLSRTIPVGGAVAVTRETFVFSSRQVPVPSRVTVAIAGGERRSFSVGLPNRNTVIAESSPSVVH